MGTIKVCRDCQERYIGCHGKCEKYLKAKEAFEAEKQVVRKAREKNMDYDSFKFRHRRKER